VSLEKVFVIIPAYREERLLPLTLRGVPDWVSGVVVVDDASPDGTSPAALAVGDPRVEVLRHPENRGVGAAIVTGYERALARGATILVVMAGDNQMDPADLPALLAPLREGRADYVKGERLRHPEARHMPLLRRLGTRALALLTSLAAGQRLTDTQCGYTALRAETARSLPLPSLWPRYGYPNDLLLLLLFRGHRVAEVTVRPIYAGEASGLRPWHFFRIAWLVVSRARKRRREVRQTVQSETLPAPDPGAA